jgi:hypothetical protein
VDGFWVTDRALQPDLDHILDLSDGEDTWSEAARFIQARAHTGLRFEVVADE